MMKRKNRFDVGDIIKFNSTHDLSSYYYLIVGEETENYSDNYLVLCFGDGYEYPLEKSNSYFYDKVS
jgi:hypothetical protein